MSVKPEQGAVKNEACDGAVEDKGHAQGDRRQKQAAAARKSFGQRPQNRGASSRQASHCPDAPIVGRPRLAPPEVLSDARRCDARPIASRMMPVARNTSWKLRMKRSGSSSLSAETVAGAALRPSRKSRAGRPAQLKFIPAAAAASRSARCEKELMGDDPESKSQTPFPQTLSHRVQQNRRVYSKRLRRDLMALGQK